MTRQKTFKRRARERMAKTGESYTAARRMLIADGDRPEMAPAFEPPVAEYRVVEATGRGWQEWFAVLDEWGALGRDRRPDGSRPPLPSRAGGVSTGTKVGRGTAPESDCATETSRRVETHRYWDRDVRRAARMLPRFPGFGADLPVRP
jgi:hypothetical protein